MNIHKNKIFDTTKAQSYLNETVYLPKRYPTQAPHIHMNDTAESGLTKRYKSLPKLIGVAVTGTSIRSIALKRINDSGYLKMEAKKKENS